LDNISAVGSQQSAVKTEMAKANNLLDLLGGLDFGPSPSMVATNNNNNNLLALNSLLASPPPTSIGGNFTDNLSGLSSLPTNNTLVGGTLVDDIFGDLGVGSPSLPSGLSNEIPQLMVYDKNDFKIVFNFEKTFSPLVSLCRVKLVSREHLFKLLFYFRQRLFFSPRTIHCYTLLRNLCFKLQFPSPCNLNWRSQRRQLYPVVVGQ